jgi:hypothetical protein
LGSLGNVEARTARMLLDGGLLMSKYAPLNEYLLECGQERVGMTFLELDLLGRINTPYNIKDN